jgi:hypothetical protein
VRVSQVPDCKGMIVRVVHRSLELSNRVVQSSCCDVHSAEFQAAQQKMRIDFQRFLQFASRAAVVSHPPVDESRIRRPERREGLQFSSALSVFQRLGQPTLNA